MKVIKVRNEKERVKIVKKLMDTAGNHLFAVSFLKRSDQTLRKMVCRRHVLATKYCGTPSGKKAYNPGSHNLVFVFDVNIMKYNRMHKLNGRGGWRSIPLDSVTRIKVGGEIYKIMA